MSNEKTKVTNNGIGFTGLLAITFIVLKLLKVITWSWIWVLSPIWISIGLWLGFLLILGLVILIFKLINGV